MPIPIIIQIIAGAVSTVVLVKIIKGKLKGKNIVALGPREAGKTTFQRFIRNIMENESPERTESIEILPKNTFKFSDGKIIRIKKGIDVGGGDDSDAKKHWENLFFNCDICFYIFDVSHVYPSIDNSRFEIMNYEIKTIKLWIKELKENKKKIPKIFVLASKADLIDNYKTLNNSERQFIKDKVYRDIVEIIKILEIDLTHFFMLNLLDKDEVTKILKKISTQI